MTGTAIVILAAGLGTRMKSDLPKVLHRIAGRSLLGHALTAAAALEPEHCVVVTGPDTPQVFAEAKRFFPSARLAEQRERHGTGHAVAMAMPALAGFEGTVLILYGDVPLIRTESLAALTGTVSANTPLAVLGFRSAAPKGYGRLVLNEAGALTAIVEELDATEDERKIDLCNSGIIAANAGLVRRLLPSIKNQNAKNEFYLTDLVGLTVSEGLNAGYTECAEDETTGVNDRRQLAAAEAVLQQRYRWSAMLNGATLRAPDTVFFSADTVLGRDVIVEPHVIFGPGVSVGDRVEIFGFSHLEGAVVGTGARIGPYARLRPGASIGEDAHIGNFVEVKQAVIGKGAKANHLSYIGDAAVGVASNIGAGTITCNYDGYEKHRTEIGANVFVGSNTALVAPVRVGDGANIAAGSVVTKNVPENALAISRPEFVVRPGLAQKYREIRAARKAAKSKIEG